MEIDEPKKCSCPYCPGHASWSQRELLALEEGPDQQMTFDEFMATLKPTAPDQE